MEKAGDVFDRVLRTDGDGERHVVDAHGDRAVERFGQGDHNVPGGLGGRDGAEYRVESPARQRLARGHVGRVEVVGVLLTEEEGKGGGTDPRNGDHEDGRTVHTSIQ